MNLQSLIKNTERPFVIAGPCSAESEAQVLAISESLSDFSALKMTRAGVWKPRTRPGSFEGKGEEALPWLAKSRAQTQLPFCVEVANVEQVEIALKYQADALWIGARTTVNPFLVQEIASSLEGVKIPILIKNPINPDLELWIGAIERFQKIGLDDLTAIHRGFSVYKHPIYRNVPMWEIPLALRERMPEIPLICDPSHITGKRDLVFDVAQTAMDLNFDGLMIETHNDPDNALSDAAQQIKPSDLKNLLSSLVMRTNTNLNAKEALNQIRVEINALDDLIFEHLKQRLLLSEKVGEIKKEHHITIFQQEHWTKLIAERLKMTSDYGLSQDFVRKVLDAIHQESIQHQLRIMNRK